VGGELSCPVCGSGLVFDGLTHSYVCPSCGLVYDYELVPSRTHLTHAAPPDRRFFGRLRPGVVAEELLRAVAGLPELVKRIRSDLGGLPEDVRRALRPFEEYYEAVTRELLRIAVEVPELAKHIDVPTTFLNFPRIVLSHRVVLSKRSYERLRELGYDIDIGCAAACGFGYLKRVDRGDSIEFIAVDCPCHPGAYFLVLYPSA